jgi:hypothetical protein
MEKASTATAIPMAQTTFAAFGGAATREMRTTTEHEAGKAHRVPSLSPAAQIGG